MATYENAAPEEGAIWNHVQPNVSNSPQTVNPVLLNRGDGLPFEDSDFTPPDFTSLPESPTPSHFTTLPDSSGSTTADEELQDLALPNLDAQYPIRITEPLEAAQGSFTALRSSDLGQGPHYNWMADFWCQGQAPKVFGYPFEAPPQDFPVAAAGIEPQQPPYGELTPFGGDSDPFSAQSIDDFQGFDAWDSSHFSEEPHQQLATRLSGPPPAAPNRVVKKVAKKVAAKGSKPYKCVWRGCTKEYAQSSTLVTHMKSHTEDPYTCTEGDCDNKNLGFDPANIIRHNKKCHGYIPKKGAKEYKCQYCGKTDTRSDNHTRHEKSCGTMFARKQ